MLPHRHRPPRRGPPPLRSFHAPWVIPSAAGSRRPGAAKHNVAAAGLCTTRGGWHVRCGARACRHRGRPRFSREGEMKARLTLLAIGMAMALISCATRGIPDEQSQHLRLAQYTENGVVTVSPDQVFEN